MKDILKKLTSRKFLASLAGVATGIAVAFGVNGGVAETIAGAAIAAISAIAYIFVEGKIDANTVKNTVGTVIDSTQTIVEAVKKEDGEEEKEETEGAE